MLLLFVVLALFPGENKAVQVGTLAEPEIREASGIVKSRTHRGVYWVHNDSGNPPALYAVRRDGTLIRRYEVSAPNIDWEDIATDGQGHLYLGDIGNNGAQLPLRAIYQLDEPDPSQPAAAPLKVNFSVFYTFPKKERFDAESLVIKGTNALLITKRLDGKDAVLKSLPLGEPTSLLNPAKPKDLGTLPGFPEPATGADLTPDGKRLAVVSLAKVRVYARTGKGWRQIGQADFRADGVEAIAWDGDDLILAGEGRGIYVIQASAWRGPARVKGPQR